MGVVVASPHVALVGLMGSGKTSVGRFIAERLGFAFRDNDVALADQTGTTAAEFAARHGTAALHDAEAKALVRLLEDQDPSVIAAASSTIEVRTCRDALERRAFVAWLHADVDILAERARRGRHRPLDRDVTTQLSEQAQQRGPLYRSVADLTVDVGRSDAVESAQQVIDALGRSHPRG